MREFFDAMDAGAYDAPLLAVALTVFVVASVWQWLIRRRAKADFYQAQHDAQRIFEYPTLGRMSSEFRWAVEEALRRWEEWQGRPVPHLADADRQLTPVEWDALSLRQSLPSELTIDDMAGCVAM